MMDLVVAGIAAGVLGTIVMDLLNHLFSRSGLILRIDIGGIGRMSSGWARGRFTYGSPSEMVPVANEVVIGYFSHYAIGLGLAVPFVLGWGVLVGGLVSPGWMFVYGIATTVASVFLVYPSMGLGVFGRKSPEGVRAPLSSLANHIFFGAGMALAVAMF
jgi:hypothetical protein